MRYLATLGTLAAMGVFGSAIWADEPATPATPEAIAEWVRELDSNDFEIRQKATDSLLAAGGAAIEAVSKAADEGTSLEVTVRAIEILGKLADSEDEATKESATKALEEHTESENRSVARRARRALRGEEEEEDQADQGGLGQLQKLFQFLPGGGRGMKMTSRVVNGQKETEIEEDGKTIKIEEGAAGITVSVTQQVDGKDQTKKYTAKDVEDLKKQHPEAAKLYEKYAGQNGGQGGVFQFQINGQNIPIPLPGIPGLRIEKSDAQKQALADLKTAVDELNVAVEKLSTGSPSTEEIKQLAEDIATARKRVDEARKKLEE